MPGHFTHIYTARRVADLLASGNFHDWPDGVEVPYNQQMCGEVMREWEKFTAIGAIGPDLFYFSQDYNSKLKGEDSDLLMLALATYYYLDAAYEMDWEPLLIILDDVSSTMAALLRFKIQMDKIWQSLIDGWEATIGQFVNDVTNALDQLTDGLISQIEALITELRLSLVTICEEELLTFTDIFQFFNTCVNKGWSEDAFLWSDMSHYRRTSAMCQNLVKQAERLRTSTMDPVENETRFRQFLAFALGYTTHVGTDTIAHSFVNEQCGGPFRDHPQRHHLIENHIDAWNYKQSAVGGTIPNDPWGSNETYPELSMSALHFAVQLTPENPHGEQRPVSLPDNNKDRKQALDVDGELPSWMCDAIVLAMIETFQDAPHPMIFGGSEFQQQIDQSLLTQVVQGVQGVTGLGLNQPFQQLLDGIAATPDFEVPRGFPMPWQIQTMYHIMISFFKFSYEGSWELQKPRQPADYVQFPWSDAENLLQPPDFSGVTSSDPIMDTCEAIVALVEWVGKELDAAGQLIADLADVLANPLEYLRSALYDVAMRVWDVTSKTHEILAHTGFMIPHGQELYVGGELRLPNEIDLPLITLGGSDDAAFQQALADVFDPLGNLDKNPSVFEDHSVTDPRYPFYSVFKYTFANGRLNHEGWEFRRPWAYPNNSVLHTSNGTVAYSTPTEKYDPNKPTSIGTPGSFPGLLPGPYPAGTTPDQVFFRLWGAPDPTVRSDYEHSPSPAHTDELNATHLQTGHHPRSPLGDPVPFSAYLIGRLANPTGFSAQFNLDSDRAFAYLTWDWVRTSNVEKTDTGLLYKAPQVPPQNADLWNNGADLLQLKYVDE